MNAYYAKKLTFLVGFLALIASLKFSESYAVENGTDHPIPRSFPTRMGVAMPSGFNVELYIEQNKLRERWNQAKARSGMNESEIEEAWTEGGKSWATTLLKLSLVARGPNSPAPATSSPAGPRNMPTVKGHAYTWVEGAEGTQWQSDVLDPKFGSGFLALFPFPHEGNFEDQWLWTINRASHAQVLSLVERKDCEKLEGAVASLARQFELTLSPSNYTDALFMLGKAPETQWEKIIDHLVFSLQSYQERMSHSFGSGDTKAITIDPALVGVGMKHLVAAVNTGHLDSVMMLFKSLAKDEGRVMGGSPDVFAFLNLWSTSATSEQRRRVSSVLSTAGNIVEDGNEDLLCHTVQLLWYQVPERHALWVFEAIEKLISALEWKIVAETDIPDVARVLSILSSFELKDKMFSFIGHLLRTHTSNTESNMIGEEQRTPLQLILSTMDDQLLGRSQNLPKEGILSYRRTLLLSAGIVIVVAYFSWQLQQDDLSTDEAFLPPHWGDAGPAPANIDMTPDDEDLPKVNDIETPQTFLENWVDFLRKYFF